MDDAAMEYGDGEGSGRDSEYGVKTFSRKMVDGHDILWEHPSPFDVRSAWMDLCFYARFAPGIVEGEYLKRGEFLASVRFLAKRWRWSSGRVFKYLTLLKKCERIAERRHGQRGTVYALVNYETYDRIPSSSRTPGRTLKRTPREHLVNKENEGNEGITKGEGTYPVGNWANRVSAAFKESVGYFNPGECGAALKKAREGFTDDEVVRAASLYAKKSPDKPAFKNPRNLAKQLAHWVKESAPISLSDDSGAPSPELLQALGYKATGTDG